MHSMEIQRFRIIGCMKMFRYRDREGRLVVNEAFIKIDLHGMRREEAEVTVERALASAGHNTYQIQI